MVAFLTCTATCNIHLGQRQSCRKASRRAATGSCSLVGFWYGVEYCCSRLGPKLGDGRRVLWTIVAWLPAWAKTMRFLRSISNHVHPATRVQATYTPRPRSVLYRTPHCPPTSLSLYPKPPPLYHTCPQLVVIDDGKRVLLGHKKRGFGAGYYNGGKASRRGVRK